MVARAALADRTDVDLIPYFAPPPPFTWLGFRVSVTGLLLLGSVVAAYVVIVRRGRAIDARVAERLAQVVLLAGVLGAHVGGIVMEHGVGAIGRPAVMLSTAGVLSSAPGVVVAGVSGWAYLRVFRRASWGEVRAWADVVAVAFSVGLWIARGGCALAHDHPGRLSSSWLAVRFPGGARLDCGLLEWLAAPVLVALAIGVGRGGGEGVTGGVSRGGGEGGTGGGAGARHDGAGLLRGQGGSPLGLFFAGTERVDGAGRVAGAVGAGYAVVRFLLDFLRAEDLAGADPRWSGLTAAQWGCVPLFGVCVWLLVGASRVGVFARESGGRGGRDAGP